jgi:hypothetical protein
MVEAPLVVPDIEFGKKVLNALDAAEFPLSVALWLKEDTDWTLVLATPLYEGIGPKEAYRCLLAALSAEHPVSLGELPLRLEGHRNPLIKALRKTFGKTASVAGMRLGGQRVGTAWIDDGYVYRIK